MSALHPYLACSRHAANCCGSGVVVGAKGVASLGVAASTSRATMRPPGPLPLTVARSMPFAFASFFAYLAWSAVRSLACVLDARRGAAHHVVHFCSMRPR